MYKGTICDVPGIRVGQVHDERGMTGVSVFLFGEGATAGVDVRGAAPGTRETDLLKSENTVQKIHAVVLTGGSAFGLDAASGVMKALEETGVGVSVGPFKVPIVCAAVLFDLFQGDPSIRPNARMGYEAALHADTSPAQGAVGAGRGATVGKLVPGSVCGKGGIGTASMALPGGGTVAAMVAVNAAGDVIDPETGIVMACGTLAGRPVHAQEALLESGASTAFLHANTTIGLIATDVALSKPEANRLATAGHDGFARAIHPSHTVSDGDTLFAVSTGSRECAPVVLQAAAAVVVSRAIVNAVYYANKEE